MFCIDCGAGDQSEQAYCKRCGKWQGASAPEQRMIVMLVFSAVSAVFGAASAIALFSTFLGTKGVPPAVYVAATFCAIISVHQTISLIFTLGLLQRLKKGRSEEPTGIADGQSHHQAPVGQSVPALGAVDTARFVAPASVVESTTELLEPVPRIGRRDTAR